MTDRIPKAYNGCRCLCHRRPGVKHFMACCGEGFSNSDPFKKHVLCSVNPEDQASTPPIKEPLTTEAEDGALRRALAKGPSNERIAECKKAFAYKYFGEYAMSENQRDAINDAEDAMDALAAARTALADCGGEQIAENAMEQEGECLLCAGKCRGHSLGEGAQWCPEVGSEASRMRAQAIEEQAAFLVARIDDLDWCDFDRLANDWNGHVDPALSRLRRSLSPAAVGGER